MTIPTLEKTWTHSVNHAITMGSTFLASSQAQIHAIKNALVSAGWTVVGSSNGSAAAMDGVDRLTTAASWTWAVNASVPNYASAWIVLKQTGIASNFQLLIYTAQTTGTAGTSGYVSVSPSSGYSLAGTATYKPTATDEVALRTNSGIVAANSTTTAGYPSVWHLMYTSDSTCWRILGHQAGNLQLFAMIDTVADAVTGWSPAFAATWMGSTTAASLTTYANFNDVATYCLSRITGVNVNLYLTCEAYISAMLGENLSLVPNDLDGLWPICPIGVASTTSTRTGRHGRLRDIYFGASGATLIEGSTYPGDDSKQFIYCGHMILPWNGSYPIIA